MCNIRLMLIGFFGVIYFTTATAWAQPKIEEDLLGPTGKWRGYTLSPRGVHVAALVSKGSRFVVLVDGVEGPRMDQMLSLDGMPYLAANQQAASIPALFSDDGAHCAYFTKAGDEYTVMLDGKELTRGKYELSTLNRGLLTFSAGGKHLYFCESTTGGYHIVMDGKPGPVSHKPPQVVTSPDGAHYAYVGTLADGMETPWGFVDGKQVKYFGEDLRFTGKQHLVATLKVKAEMALNIDGRNVIVANNISQISISPTGGEIAAVVYTAKANKTVLVVNGKPVAGTEGVGVQNVFFSPDDKHFAVLWGGNNPYMIIDGKKGQQYQMIDSGGNSSNGIAMARSWASGLPIGTQMTLDAAVPMFPAFTSDSSKFLYVATTAGKAFLVTNEDESDGYPAISPVLSPDGKHVAFIATRGYNKPAIGLDGKMVPLKGRESGLVREAVNSLAFTPDGAHLVVTANGVFYIDGVELPDLVCPGQYLYSPDSHHLLMVATSVSNPNRAGLFLDGKLVAPGPAITNLIARPTFTPDSKHLFWIGHRPPETSDDRESAVLYVDGKPTSIHFITEGDASMSGNWEVSADGVLNFVARSNDDLKRFRVTPAPDRTLTTMLAEAAGAKHK